MTIEELQRTVWDMVPFNKLLGLHVVGLSQGEVTLALPWRPEVSNHVGTTHAAALFGLGEATAGAALLVGLDDVLGAGWVPLARDGRISYLKPVPGEARATSRITEAEAARVRAESRVAGAEKVRLTVPVVIATIEGVEACTFEVDFVLVPQGPRA
jgi:acyl-coenzyme A thioesterase PaaI-like protein